MKRQGRRCTSRSAPSPRRSRCQCRGCPPHRPQQRGAGHRQPRMTTARPPSTAGSLKGEGGDAPPSSSRRCAEGDYSFVDLTQPAFDLTDRGVEGRAPFRVPSMPSSMPSAASIAAARRCMPRCCCATTSANAMTGTPVTLVVERPDGVEYLAHHADDKGAGGRSARLRHQSRSRRAALWRIKALTDPNGDAVGETSFLVEDYIPDRIEFDLKSKTARVTAGDGVQLTVDGRYLFGAPGAGLDLEANADDRCRTPRPSRNGRTTLRPDGRTPRHRSRSMPTACRRPTSTAAPRSTCALPELPVTTKPLKADVAVRMREPGGRAVEQTVSLPVQPLQAAARHQGQFRGWRRARRPARGIRASSRSIRTAS